MAILFSELPADAFKTIPQTWRRGVSNASLRSLTLHTATLLSARRWCKLVTVVTWFQHVLRGGVPRFPGQAWSAVGPTLKCNCSACPVKPCYWLTCLSTRRLGCFFWGRAAKSSGVCGSGHFSLFPSVCLLTKHPLLPCSLQSSQWSRWTSGKRRLQQQFLHVKHISQTVTHWEIANAFTIFFRFVE